MLNAILDVLSNECGIDIDDGNIDIISRCVKRRLQLSRPDTPKDYAQRLRDDPREQNQLYRDLLHAYDLLLAQRQGSISHRSLSAAPTNAISNDGNLPASTDVGTILLDSALRIVAFTPRATDVLHRLPHSIGDGFSDVASEVAMMTDFPDLAMDLQRVLLGESAS